MTLLALGCKSNSTQKSSQSDDSSSQHTKSTGVQVYEQYCQTCHGEEGKKELSGAADLTQSTLSMDTTLKIIKNGKGAMTSYKSVLSEKEMKAVANYVHTLRQN